MSGDESIIKALVADPLRHVSGQELAEELGISRAAVWKKIRALRNLGFSIEGNSSKGYILRDIEDIIRPETLAKKLKTRFVGKNIFYKAVTASTNSDAFDMAIRGAPDGTLVIADAQTAGRGRMGRSWVAPAGSGIMASFILRPDISPQTATLITLAAGIAAKKAIAAVTDVVPWIKWPNDIFVGKRKMAGILTEMHAEMDKVHFVVVGIGINVNIDRNTFPDEIRKIATSVSIEARRKINRNQLIASLCGELERAYVKLVELGPKSIIAQWREISEMRGKKVRVNIVGGKKIAGVALDLDSDGALIIELADGSQKRISAGDVELASR